MCCEHLLEQLDFNNAEIPEEMPDDVENLQNVADIAVVASYANEQMLYVPRLPVSILWLHYRI